MDTPNTIVCKFRKSRFAQDAFWAVFGNFIAKGLSLAAGIIVARFLGKETFGEYGIIRNTIMTVAIFSTFGLGYTATKFVAEYKNCKPEYLRCIINYSRNITLFVSGIMAAGLFIWANYVAERVLEAPHLIISLRLVSVWIVFNAVTTTQIGVLSGFGEFKRMARISTIIGISTFITSFIFTFQWQLNGALMALLLNQILNWWLNYRLVNRNISVKNNKVPIEKQLLKKILRFSLPIALQEALFPTASWLLSLMLIKYADYGELGLYSAAMQWNAVVLYIPGILRNVVLTHLSEANTDDIRHDKVIKTTLILNVVATIAPFLVIISAAPIIRSFYGNTFIGLEAVISIAVFSTIFSSMSNVYAQAYLSKGMNWTMFLLRILRDIGIVVGSFILINYSSKIHGAISVAIISVTMNAVFLIAMIVVYKIFKNKAQSKSIILQHEILNQ